MGFWDGYEDTSGYGSDFATKEEKEALAKSGETFDITKLVLNEKGRYGAQYLVTVLTEAGDEKTLRFAAVREEINKETGEPEDVGVPSRDAMFDQMRGWLSENKDETIPATMSIINRSYIINEA